MTPAPIPDSVVEAVLIAWGDAIHNESFLTDPKPLAIAALKAAAPMLAADAEKRVSEVMLCALSGNEPRYRDRGCIRWGLVESDIHRAIRSAFGIPMPLPQPPKEDA